MSASPYRTSAAADLRVGVPPPALVTPGGASGGDEPLTGIWTPTRTEQQRSHRAGPRHAGQRPYQLGRSNGRVPRRVWGMAGSSPDAAPCLTIRLGTGGLGRVGTADDPLHDPADGASVPAKAVTVNVATQPKHDRSQVSRREICRRVRTGFWSPGRARSCSDQYFGRSWAVAGNCSIAEIGRLGSRLGWCGALEAVESAVISASLWAASFNLATSSLVDSVNLVWIMTRQFVSLWTVVRPEAGEPARRSANDTTGPVGDTPNRPAVRPRPLPYRVFGHLALTMRMLVGLSWTKEAPSYVLDGLDDARSTAGR